MYKTILATLGFLMVTGYLLFTMIVRVDETEIAVITQFGEPIKIVTKAGAVFKLPDPIQTAWRYDKRIQFHITTGAEYLTRDKKNLVIGYFILWKISEAAKFIQKVKDLKGAEIRLSDMVASELGTVIGKYLLSDFFTVDKKQTKIPEIVDQVAALCQEKSLQEFGVEITDIRIHKLNFPLQNRPSVYQRMWAERERIANKYRAEGEEEAIKIRAKTERQVKEMLAEAEKKAQIIRGEGEAKSTRIYAEAFKSNPAFFKYTHELELYSKLLDQKTTLILSIKSPIFKYLETPPKIK